MFNRTKTSIVIAAGLLLVSQLVFAADNTSEPVSHDAAHDPLETYNRHMFMVNDTLDKAFVKPIAKAYNTLPYPIPQGIGHVFVNVSEIPTIINDLLQGQFLYATQDTWRFAINSTIGIGGFFDVANKTGLKPHDNDFGLTLARWGYKSSSYFVIPILGPSTLRDGIATVPNYYLFTVYPYIRPWQWRWGVLTLNGLSQRAHLLKDEGIADEVSIDPYVFQRNAYMQYRNAIINKDSDNNNSTSTSGNGYVADTSTSNTNTTSTTSNDYVPEK